MFQPGATNDLLKHLVLIGYLAVLARLWQANLLKDHRWFALYITVLPLRLLALMLLPNGTRLYGDVYFYTLPLIAVLSALVVLEVYQLVLVRHIGLMRMGRKVIFWGFSAAVVIALLLSGVGGPDPAQPQPLLEQMLVLERSSMLVLTVLVFAIAMFLGYFPVSLSRNSLAHTVIFSVFFLSRAAGLWMRNALGSTFDAFLNISTSLIALGCVTGWLVLLRPESKDQVVKAGPRFSAADEARILGQLQALNRTLMGSARE